MLTTFQLITLDYWENVYNMVRYHIIHIIHIISYHIIHIDYWENVYNMVRFHINISFSTTGRMFTTLWYALVYIMYACIHCNLYVNIAYQSQRSPSSTSSSSWPKYKLVVRNADNGKGCPAKTKGERSSDQCSPAYQYIVHCAEMHYCAQCREIQLLKFYFQWFLQIVYRQVSTCTCPIYWILTS